MRCVWEHNGNDTLLYSVDYVGAYTRGSSLEAAMSKMSAEIKAYSLWCGKKCRQETDIEIIQEKNSNLLFTWYYLVLKNRLLFTFSYCAVLLSTTFFAVVQLLIVSDSLRPHELQHARLPYPSLSPQNFAQTRVH